jgi:para-aminobenzoate synthetase/4-amino-4-deoxychorismate lyase
MPTESGIFLLDEHLQRLGKSAAYFNIPLDVHAVLQGVEEATQKLEQAPHRIRLLVSRDGNSEIQTFPAEPGATSAKVALAKEPVDSQDIFLFHKTTHRNAYEKAWADFPGCDDVILWNERGEVTESTIGNVVVRKGHRLITPPVECGLLAGTFREALLKAGEIEEEKISVDDLKAASEIFLVNSVRKWRSCSLI